MARPSLGAISGALAGVTLGVSAGPPGMVAGAVLGGVAGALAGVALYRRERRFVEAMQMERSGDVGLDEQPLASQWERAANAPRADARAPQPGLAPTDTDSKARTLARPEGWRTEDVWYAQPKPWLPSQTSGALPAPSAHPHDRRRWAVRALGWLTLSLAVGTGALALLVYLDDATYGVSSSSWLLVLGVVPAVFALGAALALLRSR